MAMRTRRSVGDRIPLGIALAALACSVWIVLPAPVYWLLPLSVGAPELSPQILLTALIVTIAGLARARRSRLARITVVLGVVACALSALPLLQLGRTASRFDSEMREALGDGYLTDLSSERRAALRPHPLDVVELIRGITSAPVIVVRRQISRAELPPLDVLIYRPQRPGPHPIIVQIYGGAWRAGTPGANASFARYLAAHDYLVFAVDYRHAPAWRWPAQLADVRSAIDWIRRHAAEDGGDVTRMALVGRSSGAQLATIAAYEPGALPVQAVVSLYGPVDLREGWLHPPRPDPLDVRQVEEDLLGGTPTEAGDAYRSASPISYAGGRQPPTLLVCAGHDHIVLPSFCTRLESRLRAGGTTVALLTIPWAEHAFDAVPSGPSGQLSLYYIERFLGWALREAGESARSSSPPRGAAPAVPARRAGARTPRPAA